MTVLGIWGNWVSFLQMRCQRARWWIIDLIHKQLENQLKLHKAKCSVSWPNWCEWTLINIMKQNKCSWEGVELKSSWSGGGVRCLTDALVVFHREDSCDWRFTDVIRHLKRLHSALAYWSVSVWCTVHCATAVTGACAPNLDTCSICFSIILLLSSAIR